MIGLLHVAQTGAQVDASADRQCQRLRSDRANTMQRLAPPPISSEQQIIEHFGFGKCRFCAVEGTVRILLWHHVVAVKEIVAYMLSRVKMA